MLAYADVRDLTAARLRADGVVPDIIVGSPPCPEFSAANSRAGGLDTPRGRLTLEFVRLVDECRPLWACFEQSPAIRGRGFDRVAREFRAIGYACWPRVVRAEDIGAPHERARVWVIAADMHRAGLALGQGERGDARQERTAAERGVGAERCGEGYWPDWQAGLPTATQLDDGAAELVAPSSAQYRAICAAQGDAIVPQIACIIGRAMRGFFPQARTYVDLFAGAACGWGFGMTWAGYECVGLCEIDDWRCEVALAVHEELGQ